MDGSAAKPPRGDAHGNRASEWAGASTRNLIERAQTGDARALDEILARYLPRLLRWATGRLPRGARDIVDTDDLVQDSLVKVIRTLGSFQAQHAGAFPAYLRKAVLNRLRDEARRAARRPGAVGLDGTEMDPAPTPLEDALGRDLMDRYETALMQLDDDDRSVLFLRIEMGMSYPEIADALNKPSADAARMAVNRAGIRLARNMSDAPAP
jgi:RNA polymerase sigma-70 factor (ECF subfamily)